MKSYTIEQISEIVGGMVNKVEDVKINKLLPPLKADENTLALALSEEEIENLREQKQKLHLSLWV